MKRSLLSLLLILFVQLVCAQESVINKKDTTLAHFLRKYSYLEKAEMYIVTINPDICQKCRVGITGFNERAVKNGITKKVAYVLKGLRAAEVEYFINKELSFLSTESYFIVDDKFFNFLDPYSESKLFALNGQHIAASANINNHDKIKVEKSRPANILVLTDSVTIDESKAPISNTTSIEILDSDNLVLMDKRYSRLCIINKKTGTVSRAFDISYDYVSLFSKYISNAPADIEFATRLRPRLKEKNRNEITLGKVSVTGDRIYVTCKFLYYRTNSNGDSIIANYPFVLFTDKNFSTNHFVLIPESDSFFPNYNNAFVCQYDSSFIFTLLDSKKEARKQYLGQYIYDNKSMVFKFKGVLPVELADFYLKNKINHDFGPNDIALINNKPFFYFNWSIPFIYDSNAQVYQYPDSSYTYLTKKIWQFEDLPFELLKVGAWNDNEWAFITSENSNVMFSVMDMSKNKITTKGAIPDYYAKKAKYIISDQRIYVLKAHQDKTMLYTFKHRE
jgi:hypothetical protein